MIEALIAAATVAESASMPEGGDRGVALIVMPDGIYVRGRDRSQPTTARVLHIVSWQEMASHAPRLRIAVDRTVAALDNATKGKG